MTPAPPLPSSGAAGRPRSVFANVFWVLLSKAVNIALALALSVGLANILGPSDYGRYVFVGTCLVFLQLGVGLGFSALLLREIPQAQAGSPAPAGLWGLALLVQAGVFLVLAVLSRLAAPALVSDPATRRALELALGGGLGLSLLEACESVLAAKGRFALRLVPSLLKNTLGLVAVIGLGWRGGLDGAALGLGAALLLSAGLSVGLVCWRVLPPAFGLERQAAQRWLRQAAPLALMPVLGLLYFRGDIALLTLLAGPKQTGIYQVAYTFFDAALLVPGSIVVALVPLLSGQWLLDRAAFQGLVGRFLRVNILAAFPLTVLILASARLIGLVYRNDYTASVPVLAVLALAILPWGMNNLLGNALVAGHQVRWPLAAMAVGAAFNWLMNTWLIPMFGGVGSAGVTGATEVLALAIQLTAFQRQIGGLAWRHELGRALAVSGAALAVLIGLTALPPLAGWALPAALAVFGLGFAWLRPLPEGGPWLRAGWRALRSWAPGPRLKPGEGQP